MTTLPGQLQYWPTKTDGLHIVVINEGRVQQIGVLWIGEAK
jgi:hypothetical protein